MGTWSSDSKTHVAHMNGGDFRSNEKSITMSKASSVNIEFIDASGNSTFLKKNLALLEGEIIDTTILSKKALVSFFQEQFKEAKEQNVLLSLHMKATMMKVSDPIIFGHAVKVFFAPSF